MKIRSIALVSGLLFGLGLYFSGMTNPTVVRGFFDISGAWNPQLAFVMIGALAIHGAAYYLKERLRQPLLSKVWSIPSDRKITTRLVAGSAIFGVGWAISGICPGPAISLLSTADPAIFLFVCSMVLAMKLTHLALTWQSPLR
jgi:uncharacterized membrane protein YedE/YeeE